MLKVIVTILVVNLAFLVSAFAQTDSVPLKKKPGSIQVHDDTDATKKLSLLEVLKRQKLANFTSTTIGQAFDNYRYFSKVEWKEFSPANGKYYFDVTGWFKQKFLGALFVRGDVVSRGLVVKFVIYPSGDFGVVMASRIDLKRNGNIETYPIADFKGVLDKIYANQEFSF